ncbi:MAG: type I-E CRISPR-associated protein Cse2/CasB, partial [Porticoccaceae bacterium]
MSGLIAWLEKLNEIDSKARAVLRRSLAFDPGQHIPAFPYVEPFLKGEQEGWRRDVHYLVAALWAAHWREGRTGAALSLARACAAHQIKSGSASTERRFINLLDADREQLPHRLRQMLALLGEQ